MDISDKLANLNWQRNQSWKLPFDKNNSRQAVYAFDGDVYSGLDAYTLSEISIKVDNSDGLTFLSTEITFLESFRNILSE